MAKCHEQILASGFQDVTLTSKAFSFSYHPETSCGPFSLPTATGASQFHFYTHQPPQLSMSLILFSSKTELFSTVRLFTGSLAGLTLTELTKFPSVYLKGIRKKEAACGSHGAPASMAQRGSWNLTHSQ